MLFHNDKIIVHLVADFVRGSYCSGNWKDIESFNSLAAKLAKFELIEFDSSRMDEVISLCRMAKATDIVIAYSFFPELLSKIKVALPSSKVFVRTHNAEAFQHWQRSEINFRPNYENLRSVYGSTRLAWRDSVCKRSADGLLGISNWDNRHYWRWLPGNASLYDVPYSCPWPLIRPHVQPLEWEERKKEVVCLAGGRDAIGRTMLQGFNQLADSLGQVETFSDWQFSLSPGILKTDKEDVLSSRVKRMESLDDPWDLLCSVRALAVLTPLGFGFKTTIVDALTAGCHVLLHPILARRMPDEIRALCIEFDPAGATPVNTVAQQLHKAPKTNQINKSLQDKASMELKRAFGL
jgi:hypothetical protein